MADEHPTQKQIAEKYRGNFGYFRKAHYLRRLRWWCFAAAVAASIVGASTFRFWGRQQAFSTGPISDNHARFANDCRVCHLDAEAGLSQLLRVKTAGADDAKNPPAAAALSRMDQACIQCHPTMELHLPQATGLALRKVS